MYNSRCTSYLLTNSHSCLLMWGNVVLTIDKGIIKTFLNMCKVLYLYCKVHIALKIILRRIKYNELLISNCLINKNHLIIVLLLKVILLSSCFFAL